MYLSPCKIQQVDLAYLLGTHISEAENMPRSLISMQPSTSIKKKKRPKNYLIKSLGKVTFLGVKLIYGLIGLVYHVCTISSDDLYHASDIIIITLSCAEKKGSGFGLTEWTSSGSLGNY